MQEGIEMERKYRPSSAPAKANGADFSKKFDHGTFQKFAKHKKREGSTSVNGCQSSESARKATPQKYRAFDKRPRARGTYNDNLPEEVVPSHRTEFGSALQSGSKKGNFNHLLNFTFAPRDMPDSSSWRARNYWSNQRKPKFLKEQFLQANCQFVVSEGADYTPYEADPDQLVDWELIQQVRIFGHEVPSCPICLYPPTAAKITRCGHIYCWCCMLHYLSLGDKTWRKCPICYEDVHANDLKSVVTLATHQYTAGQQIIMKLMKKERGSTRVTHIGQRSEREGKPPTVSDSAETSYCKLLIAKNDDIQNILSSERESLNIQLKDAEHDSIEGSFIQAALCSVEEREHLLKMKYTAQIEDSAIRDTQTVSLPEAMASVTDLPLSELGSQPTVTYASAYDDSEESSKSCSNVAIQAPVYGDCEGVSVATASSSIKGHVTEVADSLTLDEVANPVSQSMIEKTSLEPYFFYQASDGQHIYLNSLNARCLSKEYGGLWNAPETLTANIVDSEGHSMSQEIRRRRKYLNHLPLTCEFTVVELALKVPVLSKETLRSFADEIDKRRKLRQRKAREERKLARKNVENAVSKTGNMSFVRSDHYDQGPTPSSSSVSSPVGSPEFLTEERGSVEHERQQTPNVPLSFAQMLRTRKAKSDTNQLCASTDSVRMSHAEPATIYSDDEASVQPPAYGESFGDAIQQALNNINIVPDVGHDLSKSKKVIKKRKAKKLVFTTSMSRSK